HLGTWSPSRENASAAILEERQKILNSVLNSLYISVDCVSANVQLPLWPLSGFALGIPTTKPPDPLDIALPLDRLIRALSGTRWAVLILAEPVGEQVISKQRYNVINETRSVQTTYQSPGSGAAGASSPLAQHYS